MVACRIRRLQRPPLAEQEQDDPPDGHPQKGCRREGDQGGAEPGRPEPEGETEPADEGSDQQDLERRKGPQGRALFERRSGSRGGVPAICPIAHTGPDHYLKLLLRFARGK